MLKEQADQRRERDLARMIYERSTRFSRGNKDQEQLLWDLEYIAPYAEELLKRLNIRYTGSPYGVTEEENPSKGTFRIWKGVEVGNEPINIDELPWCCRVLARDIMKTGRMGRRDVEDVEYIHCPQTGINWKIERVKGS